MQMLEVANFGSFFGIDGFVLLILGLLIFGKRLPEVGKNLGQTIVQFKKGLNGPDAEEKPPAEPADEAPANRNGINRQGRIAASSPGRATKSLPSTEEV